MTRYVPPMRPNAPLRPKRKRPKKPKAKRHYAYRLSRRFGTYACPTCGPLGDLSAGVAHAVANQYVVDPEQP